MPGTKEIKRRIRSIKNTKKITKAMELVAASKMKRAVSSTLASRPYSGYSWEILERVAGEARETKHPFFTGAEDVKNSDRTLLILITSNRGLCGAYNAQAIKKAISKLMEVESPLGGLTSKWDVITVGKKGDSAMRRLGQNVIATFGDIPDNPSLRDIIPISQLASDEFKEGAYGRVALIYTDFVSALIQRSNFKQILPIESHDLDAKLPSAQAEKLDYLFEGDHIRFLGSLAEKLVRAQIYQMILESNASEQSARMMAMKNASEASGEMIDDLTLVFNKARQANITREISEISAGMASIA